MQKKILFLLLLLAYVCNVSSQTDSASTFINKPPASTGIYNDAPKDKVVSGRYGFLSDLEFTLSFSVLLFGVLVFLLEAYLIKIKKINQEQISKMLLVTLIIIGTLFLITAGYDNNQIAPATGLLGTIAGYLLGRSSNSEQTKTNQDE
jgi:hypothetical protein